MDERWSRLIDALQHHLTVMDAFDINFMNKIKTFRNITLGQQAHLTNMEQKYIFGVRGRPEQVKFQHVEVVKTDNGHQIKLLDMPVGPRLSQKDALQVGIWLNNAWPQIKEMTKDTDKAFEDIGPSALEENPFGTAEEEEEEEKQ